MAATVAVLGTPVVNTTAGNKTITATPTFGDLIIIITVATGVASTISDNGTGGTYTQIDSTRTGFSTTGNLQMWVRNSLVTSAASTVYTATQTSSTGGGLVILRVTGMSVAGAAAIRHSAGQSLGSSGTLPSVNLGAFTLSSNPIIGAVANASNSTTTAIQPTGYTEDFDNGYNTPATGLEVCHLASGQTNNNVVWGGNSATAFAAIAVELNYNSAPTVVLSTPADTGTVTTATPQLAFTGTDPDSDAISYEVQVHTSSTFPGIVDSYSETNRNNNEFLGGSSGFTRYAQSFTGDGSNLGSAVFYLNRASSPTGNITAALFAHSGTYGAGGQPTGSAIETSNAIDITTLPASLTLVTFTFSSTTPLINGTHYFIAVQFSGGTGVNELGVGNNEPSPTAAGNGATYNGSFWTAQNGWDFCFYVYGSPAIDKFSASDSGFTDITNGADTDPFTSGNTIGYTTTSLSNGTYYWRVRGKDPSGSNTYGSWSSTNSFTVSSGPITTTVSITKSLRYTVDTTPTHPTKSLKYTVKAPTAKTKSLQYTIDKAPAALQKSLSYVVKLPRTLTKTLKYDIKLPTVSLTKALAYTAKLNHASTKALQYSIKKTATALTKALKYTAKTSPASTKSLQYGIKISHALTKSGQYAIKRPISSVTKALKYTTKVTPAAVTKSLRYAARTTAAPTKSLQYTVHVLVVTTTAITKSLQYTVRRSSAITKSLKYATKLTPPALTKSSKYAVKIPTAITKGLKYTIKKPQAVSKALQYTVKRPAAAVTKAIKYTVKAPALLTKALVYDIRRTPSAISKSLAYSVRATRTSLTKPAIYMIKQAHAVTLSLKYVSGLQTKLTKQLQYSVKKTPSAASKSLRYAVKTSSQATKSLHYSVRKTVTAISKSARYSIISINLFTKSLKYDVITSRPALTKSLGYRVKHGVAVTKSTRYAVDKSNALTKALKYTSKSAVPVSKSLVYNLPATLTPGVLFHDAANTSTNYDSVGANTTVGGNNGMLGTLGASGSIHVNYSGSAYVFEGIQKALSSPATIFQFFFRPSSSLSLSSTQTIFTVYPSSAYDSSTSPARIDIQPTTGGYQFIIVDGSASYASAVGANAYSLGDVVRLVLAQDAAGWKLYVNNQTSPEATYSRSQSVLGYKYMAWGTVYENAAGNASGVVDFDDIWLGNLNSTPGTTAGKITDAYAGYLQNHVSADGQPYRNPTDGLNGSYVANHIDTVSEAASYALKLAVQQNDQATFKLVDNWVLRNLLRAVSTTSNTQDNAAPSTALNLMAWHYNSANTDGKGIGTIYDANFATDADVERAQALLWAHARWGSSSSTVGITGELSTPNYQQRALNVVGDLRSYALRQSSATGYYYLMNDSFQTADPVVIAPDYNNPAAYKLFAQYDTANASLWNSAVTGAYDILTKAANQIMTGESPAQSSSAKLNPDWISFTLSTGTTSGTPPSSRDTDYGYNAFRSTNRLYDMYTWYTDSDALTVLRLPKTFWTSEWAANSKIRATFKHDGTNTGSYDNNMFSFAAYWSLYAGDTSNSTASALNSNKLAMSNTYIQAPVGSYFSVASGGTLQYGYFDQSWLISNYMQQSGAWLNYGGTNTATHSITSSLRYSVRRTNSLTKSLRYAIKNNSIAISKSLRYTTRRSNSLTKPLKYSVKAAASLTKALRYALPGASADMQKALRYSVKPTVKLTKSLRYATVKPVTSLTKSIKYSVKKTPTALTKTLRYLTGSGTGTTYSAHSAASTDDAKQSTASSANMSLTDTTISITGSQHSGWRVQNVTVPRATVITKATLYWDAEQTWSGLVSTPNNITLYGDAADNSASFTTADNNITGRSRTTATGTLGLDSGTSKQDVTTIVQEILNRSGWVSGNAMSFLFIGNGTASSSSFTPYTWDYFTGTYLTRLDIVVGGSHVSGEIKQSLTYNIFNIHARSVTLPLKYSIKTSNIVSKSLRYTVVKPAAALTKSARYAIKTPIAITKPLKYGVIKIIAKTSSLKYSVKAAPSVVSKALRYDYKLPSIAVTKSQRYAIKTSHSLTKVLRYTVLNTASATITKPLRYALDKPAAISKSLKYTLRRPAAITRSLKYATKVTPIAVTKVLKYSVKTTSSAVIKPLKYTLKISHAAISKPLQYELKLARALTKSLRYGVITHSAFSKALRYDVKLPSVNITKAIRYAVKTTAPISKSLRYSVKTSHALSKSLRYEIRTAAALSKSLKYVAGANGMLLSKSLKYTVKKAFSTNKALRYEVTTVAAVSKALRYTIKRVPGAATKSVRYTVIKAKLMNKPLQYSVKHAVAISKALKYTVIKPVSVTRSLRYAVKYSPTAISKSGRYAIRTVAHIVSRTISYDIRTSASRSKALRYEVKSNRAVTKPQRYSIISSNSKHLPSSYEIKTFSAISKPLRYQLTTAHQLNIVQKYAIVFGQRTLPIFVDEAAQVIYFDGDHNSFISIDEETEQLYLDDIDVTIFKETETATVYLNE